VAIKDEGGQQIKTLHVATDHSWSDHRIALQAAIVTWLEGLVAKP
jgi:5-enolpyruvylshikimate-3-phosphate synthase